MEETDTFTGDTAITASHLTHTHAKEFAGTNTLCPTVRPTVLVNDGFV